MPAPVKATIAGEPDAVMLLGREARALVFQKRAARVDVKWSRYDADGRAIEAEVTIELIPPP